MKGPKYRQGDVYLVPTTIPRGLKKNKNNVLAYGEATGHEHTIIDGEVLVDEKGNLFVRATAKTSLKQLKHGVEVADPDIHEPIPVDKGEYKVVIQRQHTPEGWERVRD